MTTKGTRFDSFIKSCTAAKGQSFTHTRIPDKDRKIYGGAYVVSEDKEEDFYTQYYDKVFVKGELEYMTEKQLIEVDKEVNTISLVGKKDTKTYAFTIN